MTRFELRQLAEDRIVDAGILLAAGRWAAAYYLAGYAVECGLKACIAKLTNQDDFPRDRKFVEECYTHDFDKLIKSAELGQELDLQRKSNPAFKDNWKTVKYWEEESRYDQKTQVEAQTLYDAITDNLNGVMTWIRLCW